MSFNKVIVVGNLGRDPELRYTPQGSAVCNFTVATAEKRRAKSGELEEVTTWFKATLWGKQAEAAAKYLSKGSPIYLEGRVRVEEWTDRENNNRYTLELNCTDMQFLGSRNGNGGGQQAPAENEGEGEFTGAPTPAAATAPPAAAPDDDIPF